MVLSTGGGAYLSAQNREIIARYGVAVWLRADLDLLWSRVRHKSTRPLLRTANPRETLRALGEARNPLYAKAQVIVDAEPGLSIEEMAHKVADALKAFPELIEERTNDD
ncbi:MAG: shikimate kinase [Halocynthiibacter sp.]|jgi:shikimate kinase